MNFFATISFDLKDASREDYRNAYSMLESLGFRGELISDGGSRIPLPTTTCAGEFTGRDAASVRSDLIAQVQSAFRALNLTGEIFLAVGGSWAWGYNAA